MRALRAAALMILSYDGGPERAERFDAPGVGAVRGVQPSLAIHIARLSPKRQVLVGRHDAGTLPKDLLDLLGYGLAVDAGWLDRQHISCIMLGPGGYGEAGLAEC